MKQRFLNYFVLLLCVVFVVRLGILLLNPATLLADPDDYLRLAENIQDHRVFGTWTVPTAFRPPLYPLLLAGTLESLSESQDRSGGSLILAPPLAIAWLHASLGMFSALLVFATGKNLGLSEGLAFFAALLVVIDPILLQQSRLVMTETLATFFSILLVYLLIILSQYKGRRALFAAGGIGVVFAMAALCRPAFLGFAILVALAVLFCNRDRRFAPGVGLCLLLGCAIPLTCWTIRNVKHFGYPIVTTTHGGYTLLLANNAHLYDHLRDHRPWESAWDAKEFHRWYIETRNAELIARKMTMGSTQAEYEQDRIAKEHAWKEITSRPGMFFYATIVRIGSLWQCLPYNTGHALGKAVVVRYGIALFYLVELLLATLGAYLLWKRRKAPEPDTPYFYSPWLWGFMLILSVQIPHLLYWTNMRMRAPLIPILALLCAYALSRRRETLDEKT